MVIHPLSGANFTTYDYSQVYIPGGRTVTLNDAIFTTASDIILPVGVYQSSGNSGLMYLLGQKRPESLNYKMSDGNYSIKGGAQA
jgi:hypothetical protein